MSQEDTKGGAMEDKVFINIVWLKQMVSLIHLARISVPNLKH